MRAEYDVSNPFGLENPAILDIAPPEPKSLEETGLKIGLLSDIALRYLYYTGTGTGMGIAQELRLPWPGVIERVVDDLAAEKLVDPRGGKGFGRASVDFILSDLMVKYKLQVNNPDEESYREIFSRVCEAAGIPYVDQAVTYLIEHYYKPRSMQLRACHPRDLVQLIKDAARYRQIPPALSKDLLDQACEVFLVSL